MMNETIKERMAFAGTPIHWRSLNGTGTTGAVDMRNYNRVSFYGAVGTLGSSANINAYLMETDEANGANATNITNAAIVNFSTANKHFTLELRSDQTTKRYVVGVLTVDVASVMGMVPLAFEPRYHPVSQDASVNQQIVL